jgi:hypothetical protein
LLTPDGHGLALAQLGERLPIARTQAIEQFSPAFVGKTALGHRRSLSG